jgi:hypothetical protein
MNRLWVNFEVIEHQDLVYENAAKWYTNAKNLVIWDTIAQNGKIIFEEILVFPETDIYE